jgi:uncharacterized repeat protein (TIGR03803 family)
MKIRQLISVGFVVAVSACGTPTPQASVGNAALPEATVKRTSAGGTLTTLYSFKGQPDGADPQAAVSVYDNCANYCTIVGNTSTGGTNNAGTIYSISIESGAFFTESIQLSYAPSETGNDPTGPVFKKNPDDDSPLFGAASQGGTHGKGTVVELPGRGGGKGLLSFNGRNGASPVGGLIFLGPNRYLTATSAGGSHDLGTIISIAAGDKQLRPKVLYSFSGKSDGEYPNAPLWGDYAPESPKYGTTAGSKSAPATVYAFVSGQGLTTLYTFESSDDGATPTGVAPCPFITPKHQLLCGTTLKGGSGYGTLYELKPKGSKYVEVTLHAFTGGSADGEYPYGPPVFAGNSDHRLYGVTSGGGTGGCGTIFSYDLSSGKYALLYSFTCGADGAYPEASLVPDGIYLYGTTSAGGTANDGTVFSFKPR